LGAVVISTVLELLRQLETGVQIGATTVAVPLGAQELGIAVVMLLILIFRPQGLMGGHEIPSPFERGRRARLLAAMRQRAAAPGDQQPLDA
jgi:branched-chain amino acid transport system permease protein